MKVDIKTVQNLENGPSATNVINSNFAKVQEAIENTLSRDGTEPNQMQNILDMNHNRIINLPAPVAPNDPVRRQDIATLQDLLDLLQRANEAVEQAEEARDDIQDTLSDLYDKYRGALPNDAAAAALGPLETGVLYFNTTSQTFKYWDGDSWETIPYATVADGAITTQKLDDGAVTRPKLSLDVQNWVTAYRSPEDFGYDEAVDNTGRMLAVQDCFTYCANNGFIVKLKKIYNLSGGITIGYWANQKVEGIGVNSGFSSDHAVANLALHPDQQGLGHAYGVYFKNFSMFTSGGTNSEGIRLTSTINSVIESVRFQGFNFGANVVGHGAYDALSNEIRLCNFISCTVGAKVGHLDDPQTVGNTIVENCLFQGGTISLLVINSTGTSVQNNRFDGYGVAGISVEAGNILTTIEDNIFQNANPGGSSDINIVVTSTNTHLNRNVNSGVINFLNSEVFSNLCDARINGWRRDQTAIPGSTTLPANGGFAMLSVPLSSFSNDYVGATPGSIRAIGTLAYTPPSGSAPLTVSFLGNSTTHMYFVIENPSAASRDISNANFWIYSAGLLK